MPWSCTSRPGSARPGIERRLQVDVLEELKRAGHNRVLAALVSDELSDEGREHSVVTRTLQLFEHVNLQTALDAWSAEPGREVQLHGISIPPHHGGMDLQQIVTGNGSQALRLSPPPLVALANGPGSTLACLNLGLLLVNDAAGRYVLMVNGPGEHDPSLDVDIAGSQWRTHRRCTHGSTRCAATNVYRGHLLDVGANSPMGGIVLEFVEPSGPRTRRRVLPPEVLDRVERHALGVAAHRDPLLAAGQHLKRGRSCTGRRNRQAHTTRYLVGRMTGYTRLVLTGRALHATGAAAEWPAISSLPCWSWRTLTWWPRTHPRPGFKSRPLRSARCDGRRCRRRRPALPADHQRAICSTALAARPGRVDVAIRSLPDAGARARLLELTAARCSYDSQPPRPRR